MTWYLKVLWHHEFADEPVELFGEIGDDAYEVRKVDVFRDGRMEWADAEREAGSTFLGGAPTPTIEEINAIAEFTAVVITAESFEDVWLQAKGRWAAGDVGDVDA
ncbi:MAG TPA: hypothetical protein VGX23_23150 [Actinocrinis sp.]|nr:hypothetical protein [Actinocrinis sp.]